MLSFIVFSLFLASPAQLFFVESIFEHGVVTEELANGKSSFSREYTVPAGTCNFTLSPSLMVCPNSSQPHPNWLQIRVLDLRVAVTTVSENLLFARIHRNSTPQGHGRCYPAAKVFLSAACGVDLISDYHKKNTKAKQNAHYDNMMFVYSEKNKYNN